MCDYVMLTRSPTHSLSHYNYSQAFCILEGEWIGIWTRTCIWGLFGLVSGIRKAKMSQPAGFLYIFYFSLLSFSCLWTTSKILAIDGMDGMNI